LQSDAPKRANPHVPVSYQTGLKFIESLNLKVSELEGWVSAGHTLVVLLGEALFEFEWGSEMNAFTPVKFDTANLSIFAKARLQRKTGRRVKFGAQNVRHLLSSWLDKVEYQYLIGAEDRRDLLVVATALPADVQAVASAIKLGKGYIVYVPPPFDQKNRETYLQDLFAIHGNLDAPQADLPGWVEDFGTPDEDNLKSEIASKEIAIEVMKSEIAVHSDAIRKFRWLKTLVAGTGDDFLESAKAALEIIGFQTAKVLGKRTDLIARDGDRLFACEMKGLERGGKEEDLRQTKSWTSDLALAVIADEDVIDNDPHIQQCARALPNLGITPGEDAGRSFAVKGLMILATFRKKALDERAGEDFSSDMLLNAGRSEICALTAHQLANLALYCQKQPDQMVAVRDRLFQTSGAFDARDIPDSFRRYK